MAGDSACQLRHDRTRLARRADGARGVRAFLPRRRRSQVVTHVASISAALLARAMILGQDLVGAEALLRQHVAPDAQVTGLTRASLLAVYAELRLVQGAASEAFSIAERLIVWAESFGAVSRPDWNTSVGSAWPRSARAEAAEGSLRSALAIRAGDE